MHSPLVAALSAAHLLSGAAFFGALVYRTFFVDPRARRFFGRPAEYEGFALRLAHGMRRVVLAALLTCGTSGLALCGVRGPGASAGWWALVGAKGAVWVAAVAAFAYISWVFWPRRLFALESELDAARGRGLVLALAMIALAGLGLLLGQGAAGVAR